MDGPPPSLGTKGERKGAATFDLVEQPTASFARIFELKRRDRRFEKYLPMNFGASNRKIGKILLWREREKERYMCSIPVKRFAFPFA